MFYNRIYFFSQQFSCTISIFYFFYKSFTLPISFLVLFSYFSIFKPLLVVCIAYKNNIVIKHAAKPDGWYLL